MKADPVILIADDDEDDCFLIKEAAEEARLACSFRFVSDGEELMDYLEGREGEKNSGKHRLPDLMLIDLHMPRKGGQEAIREIQADPVLRVIPKVVMSTSQATEDVQKLYEMGVNSYIVKPATFDSLVSLLKTLASYWFDTVRLPSGLVKR
jgi:CheY-like chemotaxis protein